MESMNRKAPRPEKPLTAEEVVAQNQRERAARQAGRRRLSPASSKKEDTKQGRDSDGGDKSGKNADDGDGTDGSGSESEDGYMSSSSSSSIDRRGPSAVRDDVLSEVHGAAGISNGKNQDEDASNNRSVANGGGPPDSLKPEAYEYIIYLAGNSLGLQSKSSYTLVTEELQMWQTKCVMFSMTLSMSYSALTVSRCGFTGLSPAGSIRTTTGLGRAMPKTSPP